MTKTGIVMNIDKNIAHIMTTSGEFTKVKFKGSAPTLGQIYSGECVSNKNFSLKRMAMVASICCIFILGGGTYAYSFPITSLIVKINPSIELQANMWNRVIKTTPLNEDGEKVLKNISLKNKSIDNSLSMLIEEAKKENFINPQYISEGKNIDITISSKKDKTIDIETFTNTITENKLSAKVNHIPVEKWNGNIQVEDNDEDVDIDNDKLNPNKEMKSKEDLQNKNNEDKKIKTKDNHSDKDIENKGDLNKESLDKENLDKKKSITDKKTNEIEEPEEKNNKNKKNTPFNKKIKTYIKTKNENKSDRDLKKTNEDEDDEWEDYTEKKEHNKENDKNYKSQYEKEKEHKESHNKKDD